jgi:lysophospholipase L1-like esterase
MQAHTASTLNGSRGNRIAAITAGALARLDEVARVDARVSVVMLGANDVTQFEPVPEILARYRAIINRLADRSEVIVVSTTLRAASQTEANAEIAALNGALAKECSSGSCRFIDLNAEIAPDGFAAPEFLIDPVHLSPAAYARWREIMRRALGCAA